MITPKNTAKKSKALVLDATRDSSAVDRPSATAQRIARQLESEGFSPQIDTSIPGPGHPDSLGILRARLERFAAEAALEPSSYAPCVHPGISSWADRPEFAGVAQELGLAAITPSMRTLSLFANKLNFLSEAENAGVATLVMSYDPIYSPREVERLVRADPSRLPIVLKSVRSGGGLGVFVVRGMEDVERRLPLWLEQIRRNHGEVILFPERYLDAARRISVPFCRFRDGSIEIFSWSDVSLQSKYRRLIEFSPPQQLDPQAAQKIEAWTRKFADHLDFRGVGSFEFFAEGGAVYILDGLARLNVGTHLWERLEDTCAVTWQLAALELSDEFKPSRASHATVRARSGVAARIYAEDPLLQIPQPGWVREVSPCSGAMLELSCTPGSAVPPPDDGLIGVLQVVGGDRDQAIAEAKRALSELWIAGSIQTNERFVGELLAHPWVRDGIFHASFVDEDFVPEIKPQREMLELMVALAMLASERGQADSSPPSSYRWAVVDEWVKPAATPLEWKRPPEFFEWAGLPGFTGELASGLRVCVHPVSASAPERWSVRVGAWILTVRRLPSVRSKSAGPLKLRAQVSGRVHAILYREGGSIPAHEPVVVVESLRVLVPHALPIEAKMISWLVSSGDTVETGQELGVFEKIGSTYA